MKRSLLLGLLLLPLAAFGRDTAYQALRTVGSQRDPSLLSRVVEVKGKSGAPQPENWVIVLDDPMARGGVREVEVSNGRIVSERTPVKAYGGSAAGVTMDFQKLNLDSQGAFTLVEQEARAAKVRFDSLDYVLRRDDPQGAPIWFIQLLDTERRNIGSLTIAADTGNILSRSFSNPTPVPSSATSRRQEVEREYEEDTRPREHLGRRIDRTFRKIGGKMENFFTGKRTIDRQYRDD